DRGRHRRFTSRAEHRGHREVGQYREDRRRKNLRLRSGTSHSHPHRRDRRGSALRGIDMKRFIVRLMMCAAVAFAAPAIAQESAPALSDGDTAWMLTSTMLVILMTIPGLALFYGGLARSKNMLSVLLQVFSIFSLITILWTFYGYS